MKVTTNVSFTFSVSVSRVLFSVMYATSKKVRFGHTTRALVKLIPTHTFIKKKTVKNL